MDVGRAAGREYFGQTAQPVGVPSFVSLGDKKPTLFFAVIVPDQVCLVALFSQVNHTLLYK